MASGGLGKAIPPAAHRTPAGGAGNTSDPAPPVAPPPPTGPLTFHCSKDSSCPDVMVAGDPFAAANGVPVAFRGYGDPSLEYDPASDTLTMGSP